VVGAAIVWVARRFLPGDGGHEPLRGLDPTPVPVRNAPGVSRRKSAGSGDSREAAPDGGETAPDPG
jgi:hypothetical protein